MNIADNKSGDERKFFKLNTSLSIGLTTIAVILMILLLALTINRARENEMVEQYSRQQVAMVKVWAAGIEDSIINIEKGIIALSRLSTVKNLLPGNSVKNMKVIFESMEGRVHFITELDKNGTVLASYPSPSSFNKTIGRYFWNDSFSREIRKTKEPYISKLIIFGDKMTGDQDKKLKTVIICVPKFDANEEFAGVTVAGLSLTSISNRYLNLAKDGMSTDYWIVDNNNIILTNTTAKLVGQDVGALENKGGKIQSLKKDLLQGKEGYNEYLLNIDGKRNEKYIAAYAPIRLGEKTWFVVVITPYKMVISLVRKTFINVMFGAAGLIIAVIIAGISVIYAGRKRLSLDAELKRLKEREDWQEKLTREKKTIEGIIEGSPIPTFVVDREHKVLLWNKACAELTGYNAGEMIGTDKQYLPFYNQKRPVIADLIINRDFEGLANYYGTKKVKKSAMVEGAYEARDYFENLGGKSRHLYFLAAPIYDDKGEIIASIETLQDISVEVEMAKNLQDNAETLQNKLTENINLTKEIESLYNYLQSLVASSPDRLFDFGLDGIINYISPDISRDKGLDSQQVKGKFFTEFVAPEHREIILAKWIEARKGVYEPFEIEVTAKDGTKRNLLISMRPVKGADRFVIVQRDITDFKNLERRFYESEKLAAIGQLSAGIAHEVRNALSSIKMSLQILEKRLLPVGNDLKRFDIARREVEHLEELVNDVLIFAKPINPQKEPSDIKRILEHALGMAERGISDKHTHVQMELAEDIPLIKVDAAMLEQAFLNIYRNAIEAIDMNGEISVSVKLIGNEDKSVLIEIKDNGCGIDEEDFSHLFNPFFTNKKYGTGLGLTQVKKIIDLHQGIIEIVSKKNKGTKVIVTIPFEQGTINGQEGH